MTCGIFYYSFSILFLSSSNLFLSSALTSLLLDLLLTLLLDLLSLLVVNSFAFRDIRPCGAACTFLDSNGPGFGAFPNLGSQHVNNLDHSISRVCSASLTVLMFGEI